MIKGTKGLMLLSISFFLSGCGFNEEEALEKSTEQLESFLTLHEERERVSDLNTDDLQARLEDEVFPYLTESYQEKITEEVENYEFNTDAVFSKDLFFLRESEESYDNGVFWQAFSIEESNVNPELEVVNHSTSIESISTITPSLVEIEMNIEDGEWKLNSVEEGEW